MPGEPFFVEPDANPGYLRLNFSHVAAERMDEDYAGWPRSFATPVRWKLREGCRPAPRVDREETMLKVYGDYRSGNCYKIKLMLHLLDQPYEWIAINILRGETRSEEFLKKNPNGKIPVLELEDGSCLWESNAILNYLAEGSEFLPTDPRLRTQVLQWQFFEQYSHEPFIAVARYIKVYLGMPEERREEYEAKQLDGYHALNVMEQQLLRAVSGG